MGAEVEVEVDSDVFTVGRIWDMGYGIWDMRLPPEIWDTGTFLALAHVTGLARFRAWPKAALQACSSAGTGAAPPSLSHRPFRCAKGEPAPPQTRQASSAGLRRRLPPT